MRSQQTHTSPNHRRAPLLKKGVAALVFLLLLATVYGCKNKENTARNRFWQSFTAKYNTYFNGHEAYKEGIEAQETGNADNFTEMIPFFAVANEKTAAIGKGNFETAVEKCEKAIQLHSIKKKPKINPSKSRSEKQKNFLAQKEFNPFLKNAWLLMGKAQFHTGDFLEAASTFSYITRLYSNDPEVRNEARAWLARCYAQIDWFYDAEDVLSKLNREELEKSTAQQRDATTADLLLRQQRFADALPYLYKAAKSERRKIQRARIYFLIGQVEQNLGHRTESYKALQKCLRQSPPYNLAFNARILQTEVLSESGQASKMISTLKRMARSDKNKDYLDQVYYAMGNIYLAQKDTAAAISAYENGRTKATRSGIEKGVLLLRLGGVYWEKERFDKAQTCYSEALSMIDKTQRDYKQTLKRSKVLDKLVPYTSAVYLQDSLQVLSRLPEKERNAAIDRVIEALKKQEKEQAKAKADSAAKARAADNGVDIDDDDDGQERIQDNTQKQKEATWYFYNPTLVAQGKQDFKKQWGTRKNEDDWRRSNKTVLQFSDNADEELSDSLQAVRDSIEAARAKADTVLAPENDPHKREYYLKQIPFTPEAKATSDSIIMDGLYNAGIIEKDELEDFPLAERTLTRITRQYPSFDRLQDTYYQLYLLYARWGRNADAEYCRTMLANHYPDSATTKKILDPNFLYDGRYGRAIEDSLYTATYLAYQNHRRSEVEANYDISTRRYPDGINRPKFIFLHALNRIGKAPNRDIANELRELVQKYPQSDVSALAGLIVNGLEAGRQPGTGGFDIGSLWARRTAANDSLALDGAPAVLSPERNTKFVFITAYERDSLDDNRLLYDLAHFNFTGFYVRNFEIEKSLDYGTPLSSAADTAQAEQILRSSGLVPIVQFQIKGFKSFDEAHTYAQELFANPSLAEQLRKTRIFLISEDNLKLMGRQYSFNDYQAFYDSTFAPLEIAPNLPLDTEGDDYEQKYEDLMPEIYPKKLKEDEEKEKAAKEAAEKAAKEAKAAEDAKPADEPEEPVVPEEGEDVYIEEPTPAEPAEPEPQPAEDDFYEEEPAVETPTQPAEEPAQPTETPAEPAEEPVVETPAEPEPEPAAVEEPQPAEQPAKPAEEPAVETPVEPEPEPVAVEEPQPAEEPATETPEEPQPAEEPATETPEEPQPAEEPAVVEEPQPAETPAQPVEEEEDTYPDDEETYEDDYYPDDTDTPAAPTKQVNPLLPQQQQDDVLEDDKTTPATAAPTTPAATDDDETYPDDSASDDEEWFPE